MTSLRESYDALRAMLFPPHPDSDVLDDWILELSETDAYFAGLAQRILGGENPRGITVVDIDILSKTLDDIVVESTEDQRTYQQCKEYVQSLRRVRDALIEHGCQE